MSEVKQDLDTGLEVAVIGMAGRFPGAKNIEAFWNNLIEGIESISFLTEKELEGISPELRDNPNFVKTVGGFLENIEYFDASFFNYTPMEAEQMAPQIRIFHECLWEVLEDAGYDPECCSGLIGLYTGVSSTHKWELLSEASSARGTPFTYASYYLNNRDFLSTLVSYKLNLKGPAYSMHTTCSTSLVAIHLACQGLLSGDCDMALAGGIAVRFEDSRGYVYEEGMILSPDGHCRAFDAEAKGSIGGNGVGLVALKRLDDAVEDRDNIYAVVKGSAINNDGKRKVGYTAPSIEGQAGVIRKAHKMAEVHPEDISYVETHGTATPLGDVTEVEALKIAFNTGKKHFCALGSVKTNVGHLDVAAGVAGFIKTVLALKHKLIPPSLHFKTPNPKIDFENSPFYVNASLREWKNDDNHRLIKAGVSSFGIGGTNAHIVLEEWGWNRRSHEDHEEHEGRRFKLLLLSAKTPSSLDTMTENLAHYLTNNPGNPVNPENTGLILANAAYTLQVGRRRFPYRRKLVCSTIPEAIDRLTVSDSRMVQTYSAGSEEGSKPVVFMFPGLGPQYVNMGLGLYRTEPLFRKEMDHCFDILKPLGFDIKEILYPPVISNRSNRSYISNINETEIAQLVVFIFEYALAKLLMNWGIKPRAMIGYSFGEYTAACLSGVFSLDHVLQLLVARGKLIRQLPAGMMLSVPLPVKDVEPLLSDELSIGIDNGSSCVVSGEESAVRSFEHQMKGRKRVCMPLESTHAIHSKMMESILKPFESAVRAIILNPPRIPYISSVTGNWIRVGEATSPGYWVKQLRETVCFAKGMQKLLNETDAIHLEVGPGRDISALVNRAINDKSGHQVINLVRHGNTKKQVPDDYYLLDKIGRLWLYGVNIDWAAYYSEEKRYRISLPTYPFERQRYWQLVDDYKAGKISLQAGILDMHTDTDTDTDTVKSRDLSEWFYVPSWKRKKIRESSIEDENEAADAPVSLNWLVFIDNCGLGGRLINRLNDGQRQNQKIVTVKPGSRYTKQNNTEYTINPVQYDDYETLFRDLNSMRLTPDRIIHLWGITNENQEGKEPEILEEFLGSGFYSLLYLSRALGRNRVHSEKIEINVLTNNMQDVTGHELLHPGKATVLGPCRVIPQEYPNIICKSIDIDLPESGNWQYPVLLNQLIEEFTCHSEDKVTAYRGCHRWVQIVDPVYLKERKKSPLLRERGVYLIVGGLGNIGNILAEYLIKSVGARLILTGLSNVPPKEMWGQFLIISDEEDKVIRDIRKLKQLEEIGGDIIYYSADVSDKNRMLEVIRQSEAHFGRIDGVIHSADVIGGQSFSTIEDITLTECHQQFQAKLYGLLVLEELLQDKELDFCLMISSISTVLGGLGFAAYAAANHFMDAFSIKYNRKNQEPWIVVNWEGTTKEDTEKAFHRILSSGSFEQVIFSIGGDLEGRISRWIQLEDKQKSINEANAAADLLYSRPDLSTPYIAPRNAAEQRLADIWQRFLGIEKIGVTDDLFDLGGDSLKAINILSIIHKELNVVIPIKEFFDNPTIEGVAAYLADREGVEGDKGRKETYLSIEPTEKKEYYVISSAQKRMYIFQQMNSDSIAYNSPMFKMIEGEIDIGKLEDIFKQLIQRHESLRTSIETVNDEPVQRIHERNYKFQITNYKSQIPKKSETASLAELCHSSFLEQIHHSVRQFVHSFDLSRAPLMRVGLMEVNEKEYLLMVDMPHIISDGVSMGVLISEFMDLYKGKELPELRVQYKDYAEWQNRKIGGEALQQQEAFWLKEFEGEIPVLDLPTDYKRPRIQDFAGNTSRFDIDSSETRDLKAFALEEGATLFMVLLSIYNIFLSKISNQDVIVVGTPTAGRFHADLDQVFGMFVNTLALKNDSAGEKTVREFLRKVKEKTLAAFAHQGYQYEELVEKVMGKRDTSRSPLFDTMLLLLNMDIPVMEIPGLKLKSCEYKQITSKFDLTLICYESEKSLACSFEYSTKLFKEETIERFIGYLKKIVSTVVESPDKKISEINILPEEEKKQLVKDFNDTAMKYPGDKTIYQLFEDQVDRIPDHVALKGPKLQITNSKLQTNSKSQIPNYKRLGSSDLLGDNVFITYKKFDERANQLANYLRHEKGIGLGERVAVLMERSIELIVSLMAVMKSGAAYVPLDPTLPKERLQVVFNDASIGVAISQEAFSPKLTSLLDVVILNDGGEIEKYPAERPEEIARVDSPAYVMYTSGSSGTPKGVLVEHRTIVNTLWWRKDFYEYNPDSVSLQNPPYFFDSSMTDIFTPLLGGARLVLIEENERVDLEALRKVIKVNKVSHFIAVPAFYNILVEEIADDLSSVKMICVAGEHFPDELVRKHFEKLPHVRIVNEYGPTENSVNTTVYELQPDSQKALIGKPIWNVSVYILDRHLCLCPIGVTGEMCLAGSSLARGYLNSPELTAEKFLSVFNRSYRSNRAYISRKFYRTGDLGRWLPDGNLEFIGRLDTQIKIRGMRVEIGEIENHLMRHEEIKEAVVLARENQGGEKYLCAYIVPHSSHSPHPTKLREYLSHTLPEYMIPTYFMVIDSIPFMPSGKINREALPDPGVLMEGRTSRIAPRNRVEMKLVEIWAEVLGIEKEEIGIDCDFFQLGGHSLKATLLTAKIHKHLNVKIPLVEIFRYPTIRELSELISKAAEDKYVAIENAEEKEYYPLAPAQKRLYILQKMNKSSIAYNLPQVVELDEDMDKNRLEETFRKLVERHENLRTSFHMVKDQPVQKVHDKVEFFIEYYELTAKTREDTRRKEENHHPSFAPIIHHFIRPFDLSQAPLMRVGLIKTNERKCILMVDNHHIISDAISNQILIQDYWKLYKYPYPYLEDGGTLPALKFQYKDYSEWINSEGIKGVTKQQETFWLNTFRGRLPVLHLPTDYVRPSVNRMEGDQMLFEVGEQETKGVHALALEHGATPFMVVLSIYTVFLSKLSGQEDIIVGSPIAGRRHSDLEQIIGMFVGTLPLRNYPAASKTFKEFLEDVRERILDAFENQDYPFEELLEKIDVFKEASRNPLFDVFFQFYTVDYDTGATPPPSSLSPTLNPKEEMADAAEQQYPYHPGTSKFDLYLYGRERNGRMVFSLEYSTQLFKQETIKMYIKNFKEVVRQVVENKDIKLQNIVVSFDIYDKKIDVPETDFAF
jgi:amino acid adenylation domain-containing protein